MMHQNSGGASRDTAVRIVDLMIRFGPQILLLLGTILTILTSAFPDASFSVSGRIIAWRWFFALCAVAFLVIGTFASFRSGSLLGKRQREVEQARGLIEGYRVSTENLLRFLLAELLREIQLTTEKGVPKPEVRGSIYCPTTDYEHFLLIARKTGNPEWERPVQGSTRLVWEPLISVGN